MVEETQTASALVGLVLDGSYRIKGLLGEGGMGAVYHATQLRLDKPVAVKVMARELAANQEALERFRREARVTSALGHPHIIQVFDFSTMPTGEPYLVMELLEGEDLEHRIARLGRLPRTNTVHIIKQVSSALTATHAKGVVHRDLKPANIYLLSAAGEKDFVKVLDFGISKVRSASTKLTRTSSIMGSPFYMSPEQARGKVDDIDERTDEWALACIAWECLSGQPPFVGDTIPSVLFQIVHEQPDPLLPKVKGLAPQVEQVLLHALAKDKNERFPSVGDFVAAFTAAVDGTRVPPTSVRTTGLPNATSDSGTRAKITSSTTLSQTAGELNDGLDAAPTSKRRVWALAAGAAVVLLFLAFVPLRPSSTAKPVLTSPPAATTPSPAAASVTPPMPEAKLNENPAEAKVAPTASPSKPNTEPEVKKPESAPTSRAAKKRLPRRKPEEDQQLWH